MIYLILILALSLDTFMASLSYSVSNIKIPISSNTIICFICSITIGISFILGNLLSTIIPSSVLKWISFSILFLIGFYKIFENFIKKRIKKKKLKLSLSGIILEIYLDYSKADLDSSKKLSNIEAFFLAIALSIDGLASGLAFQTSPNTILILCIFCFILNFIVIILSGIIGKIISNFKFDFASLSGIAFIILAFFKL